MLARELGAELAIRSGGHSLAGHGVEGGIVLDLSRMRAMEVDADGRTAWAETGLTAGRYTVAAGAHGLATGFGDTGSVGIGGITLGGGVGFLVRKHGLTIDDLQEAELVTADGELRDVDAETHPSCSGRSAAASNTTRFRFRLHPVDGILGGLLILPATPEVIASFVAEAEAAPDELSTIANVMVAPPMPFLPAEAHGQLVILALVCYAGEIEAGERASPPSVLSPIRSGTPCDRCPMPRSTACSGRQAPRTRPGGRALLLRRFRRQRCRGGGGRASPGLDRAMAVAQLRVLGGAMARVPVAATAFAHRERRVMVAWKRSTSTPMRAAARGVGDRVRGGIEDRDPWRSTSTSSVRRAMLGFGGHRGTPGIGSRRSSVA